MKKTITTNLWWYTYMGRSADTVHGGHYHWTALICQVKHRDVCAWRRLWWQMVTEVYGSFTGLFLLELLRSAGAEVTKARRYSWLVVNGLITGFPLNLSHCGCSLFVITQVIKCHFRVRRHPTWRGCYVTKLARDLRETILGVKLVIWNRTI